MIICDSHIVVNVTLHPEQLSKPARRAWDNAQATERACLDVCVWEMAALFVRSGDRTINRNPRLLIEQILETSAIRLLRITPEIAVTAAGLLAGKGDPIDRLIAATAIVHNAPLISADKRLHGIPGLKIIW